MSPEARALAQALLDHHDHMRGSASDASGDIDLLLISYGDLCERARLPHIKPMVGKFLREIAQWCHENGWPPLNALAVNHDTCKPGHGYDTAPGCSMDRWREQMIACLRFSDYPDRVN